MRVGLIETPGATPFVAPTPDPEITEHDKLIFRLDALNVLSVFTEDVFGQEYLVASWTGNHWVRHDKSYDKMVVVS